MIPIGTTTPGPPVNEGEWIGVCAHHGMGRVVSWELVRSGDALHLWHGDWITGEFEIFQCGHSQSYIARAVPLVGKR